MLATICGIVNKTAPRQKYEITVFNDEAKSILFAKISIAIPADKVKKQRIIVIFAILNKNFAVPSNSKIKFASFWISFFLCSASFLEIDAHFEAIKKSVPRKTNANRIPIVTKNKFFSFNISSLFKSKEMLC